MAEVVKLRRPATRDHLRSKPRARQVVEVYLDNDALAAFNAAEEELGRAKLTAESSPKPPGADKALKAAQAKRDTAKAALDETTVEILLQSIPRRRYEELQQKHPPTPKQMAAWQERVDNADEKVRYFLQMDPPAHDPDGLGIALIAASAVEPELTEDDVREILDDWTVAEAAALKTLAFNLNSAELIAAGKGRSSNGSTGTSG